MTLSTPPAPASPASRASLFQIGPYDVIAKLAHDELGASYLCRCSDPAQLYEVVHLDDELTRDPRVAEALDRARPALALAHPNLAPVELGAFAWGSYLARAYRDEATLGDLLARTRSVEPAVLARIVLDVLDGLTAAHTANHSHLDLTPARIAVGCDGVSRVSGLGLAELRGIATPEITPYTAPRRTGEPAGPRADVFAVGAIAWTASTGHGLFAGRDAAGTRQRLLMLDVPPPSEIGARPPANWDPIVLRALARDPEDRYATAAEMARVLRDAVADVATPSEVGLWVKTTFAEPFAARRAAIDDHGREPMEVAGCPLLGDAIARPRRPASTHGALRSAAMLAAALVCGGALAFALR